jgi:hypothetical protein
MAPEDPLNVDELRRAVLALLRLASTFENIKGGTPEVRAADERLLKNFTKLVLAYDPPVGWVEAGRGKRLRVGRGDVRAVALRDQVASVLAAVVKGTTDSEGALTRLEQIFAGHGVQCTSSELAEATKNTEPKRVGKNVKLVTLNLTPKWVTANKGPKVAAGYLIRAVGAARSSGAQAAAQRHLSKLDAPDFPLEVEGRARGGGVGTFAPITYVLTCMGVPKDKVSMVLTALTARPPDGRT